MAPIGSGTRRTANWCLLLQQEARRVVGRSLTLMEPGCSFADGSVRGAFWTWELASRFSHQFLTTAAAGEHGSLRMDDELRCWISARSHPCESGIAQSPTGPRCGWFTPRASTRSPGV